MWSVYSRSAERFIPVFLHEAMIGVILVIRLRPCESHMNKVVIYYSWQCSRVDSKNVRVDLMPDLKDCGRVVITDSH